MIVLKATISSSKNCTIVSSINVRLIIYLNAIGWSIFDAVDHCIMLLMYVWYTGGNFASFCVGILKLCPDNSRNLKKKKKKKRICVGRRRTTTTERKKERESDKLKIFAHNTHNTQTRPPPLLITSKSISEEQLFFCGSSVRSVYMQFHQARNVTVAERDLDAGGGGRCLLACLPACLLAKDCFGTRDKDWH